MGTHYPEGAPVDRPETGDHQRQSQDLEAFHLLLENITDFAIFFLDADGTVTYWNAGAQRIFGYQESEIIGESVAILFTREDRLAGVHEREIQKAMAEGRSEDDRWMVRKDGRRFFAGGVLTRLTDETSAFRGFAKILRDNTRLARAEEELRHSHEDLESRVGERTLELGASNYRLQAEVSERRASQLQTQNLLRRLINSQEEERLRISRDLHDTLGQHVTALRLKVEAIRQAGNHAGLSAPLAEVAEAIQEFDTQLEFLAWELRVPRLDQYGLAAAIETYVGEWSQNFGVTGRFQAAGFDGTRLSLEAEMSLYRVTQEALNNTAKYADASRVDVVLERRDGEAVLVIEDDGRGFDPEAVAKEGSGKKLGLIGINERAALVGGRAVVESAPGKGTVVIIRVPIR